jgi:hypothetical protein
MPRFVTFLTYDCDDVQCLTEEEIRVLKEDGSHESVVSDWEEWVWQFADSVEQAIAQHASKMDEYEADNNALRPIKETY